MLGIATLSKQDPTLWHSSLALSLSLSLPSSLSLSVFLFALVHAVAGRRIEL